MFMIRFSLIMIKTPKDIQNNHVFILVNTYEQPILFRNQTTVNVLGDKTGLLTSPILTQHHIIRSEIRNINLTVNYQKNNYPSVNESSHKLSVDFAGGCIKHPSK